MHEQIKYHLRTSLVDWHYCQSSPKGTCRVLGMHGLFGGPNDFLQVGQFLHPQIQLTSLCLPGHGKTSIRSGYSLEELKQNLIEFIQWYAPDIIIGYSLGGRLLLQIADSILTMFPNLKIVIISSAPGCLPSENKHQRLAHDQHLLDEFLEGKQSAEEFFDHWYQQPIFNSLRHKTFYHELIQSRLELLNPKTLQVLQYFIATTSVAAMPESWNTIVENHQHFFYLYGEHDLKYGTIATNISALAPQMQVIKLENCSHALLWESPQELAQIINFLSESSTLPR